MYALFKSLKRVSLRGGTVSDLNLINVDLSVLLLHFLIRHFHGVDGRHRISQVIGGQRGRLHVENLLR